jgi:hypothetical protein
MSEEKSAEDNQPKTIDDAITACESIIFWHRIKSFLMLGLLVVITYAFYAVFRHLQQLSIQLESNPSVFSQEGNAITDIKTRVSAYPYLIFGLFLLTFGIIVSLYRFHITEISRNEQIKLGFWRISIAARNTSAGFQTEVRQSLTKDAFVFNRKVQGGKNKEVESPIPGHPTSDFAAVMLNKILENMEINVSKKDTK